MFFRQFQPNQTTKKNWSSRVSCSCFYSVFLSWIRCCFRFAFVFVDFRLYISILTEKFAYTEFCVDRARTRANPSLMYIPVYLLLLLSVAIWPSACLLCWSRMWMSVNESEARSWRKKIIHTATFPTSPDFVYINSLFSLVCFFFSSIVKLFCEKSCKTKKIEFSKLSVTQCTIFSQKHRVFFFARDYQLLSNWIRERKKKE